MKTMMRVYMLCVCVCVLLVPGRAQAIDLLDGKVRIHGKWSNQVLMRARDTKRYELHDYKIFNARSTLKLETMWHAYEGPDYSVNFYGVWKQFYDGAHRIDNDYKRYLRWGGGGSSKSIKQLNYYHGFEDICREMYMEFNAPLFQVRLGKQIISWGETTFERMVDNINPVDLRGNLNPAYPDFAEIKRGLWMARLFFTPFNHPMDLTYELIIIPDFEPTRLWPAGYHLSHPRVFNNFRNPDELFLAYYRDAPSGRLKKPEFGIRIRGFVAGFDWTLSYFHHRTRDGVLGSNKALKQGLGPLLGNSPLGRMLGTYPLKNIYRYPWQETIGLTLNRPVNATIPIIPGTTLAMSGNIFRLEAVWERNKAAPQEVALGGLRSRITKQDRYAVCFGWSTRIFLPYITPWARNKYLSSTTQLFFEVMPDKSRKDLYFPWVTYGRNHKHWTVVTQELSYELWNGRILPGFYGAWYTNQGGGFWAPALGFKPQFRHTFIVRYLNFYGLDPNPANVNSKDFWTFEYTYEF